MASPADQVEQLVKQGGGGDQSVCRVRGRGQARPDGHRFVAPRREIRNGIAGEQRQPLLQSSRHVAVQRRIHLDQLAQFAIVDVDVHNPRVRREPGQLTGHPIVKADTHCHDQVALNDRLVAAPLAVHPRHAQPPGIVRVSRPDSVQRGDHRDPGQIAPLAKQLGRVGELAPAADDAHRPLRALQQFVGQAHLAGVADRAGDVAVDLLDRFAATRGGGHLHVLGDIHHDRTGPAGGRDEDRLGDHLRQLVHIAHLVVMFADGGDHAGNVRLLKGVGADQRGGHLPGDAQQGGRIHRRGADAGHQVGRPRA
jgi:hypothetical protein